MYGANQGMSGVTRASPLKAIAAEPARGTSWALHLHWKATPPSCRRAARPRVGDHRLAASAPRLQWNVGNVHLRRAKPTAVVRRNHGRPPCTWFCGGCGSAVHTPPPPELHCAVSPVLARLVNWLLHDWPPVLDMKEDCRPRNRKTVEIQ